MRQLCILALCMGIVLSLTPGCVRQEATPPEVGSITPAFGEQEVALDKPISISFTRSMNRTSLESNFRIEPVTSGEYSWSHNAFMFTPDSLMPGTEYTVYFAEPPWDTGGNNLGVFFMQFATDTPVAATYTIMSFQWMPDGQSLVYNSDQDGLWGIWQVDLNNREQHRLVESNSQQRDPYPSVDGEFVVYVSSPTSELHLYNTNTQSVSKYVLDSNDMSPAWPMFSPDGKYLAFLSVLGGADAHSDIFQSLHLMDLTQSPVTITNISPTEETDWVLGFNSDSTRLYVLSTFKGHNYGRNFRYDLWAIDLISGEKLQLTTDGPVTNGEAHAIWVMNSGGGGLQRLTR